MAVSLKKLCLLLTFSCLFVVISFAFTARFLEDVVSQGDGDAKIQLVSSARLQQQQQQHRRRAELTRRRKVGSLVTGNNRTYVKMGRPNKRCSDSCDPAIHLHREGGYRKIRLDEAKLRTMLHNCLKCLWQMELDAEEVMRRVKKNLTDMGVLREKQKRSTRFGQSPRFKSEWYHQVFGGWISSTIRLSTSSEDLVGDRPRLSTPSEDLMKDRPQLRTLSEDLVGDRPWLSTHSKDLVGDRTRLLTLSEDLVGDRPRLSAPSEDLMRDRPRLRTLSEDLVVDRPRLSSPSEDLIRDRLRLRTPSVDLVGDHPRLSTSSEDLIRDSLRLRTLSEDMAGDRPRLRTQSEDLVGDRSRQLGEKTAPVEDIYQDPIPPKRKLILGDGFRSRKLAGLVQITKKPIVVNDHEEEEYINNYEGQALKENAIIDLQNLDEKAQDAVTYFLIGAFAFLVCLFMVLFPVANFFKGFCGKSFFVNICICYDLCCCRDPKYRLVKKMGEQFNVDVPDYKVYKDLMNTHRRSTVEELEDSYGENE